MIKGLDTFREHFKSHRDAFVMIGGAACHEWLASLGLEFRATKDLDVVLIIEALDQSFVERFWQFVDAANYEIREGTQGDRELYRFSRPKGDAYPAMIEIFTRKPDRIELAAGQHIVPIAADDLAASLSAILLEDEYYKLIIENRVQDAGAPFIRPAALIPLKARAWLDLTKRKTEGQNIDSRDIAKHRTDLFRIAATLSAEPVAGIPDPVRTDLNEFLEAFPSNSLEWTSILESLRTTFTDRFRPHDLIEAVRIYFKL